MSGLILAGLEWNVTTRGILFPALMFTILGGATYMILATNVGNRLGFLLANAAFWGWMALMSAVWMIYGIGLKGDPPSWRVSEVIKEVKNAQADSVASLDLFRGDLNKLSSDIGESVVKATAARTAASEARAAKDSVKAAKAQEEADALAAKIASLRSQLPKGWRSVEEGTATRGEAQSSADAYMLEEKLFPSSVDYAHVGGFEIGGEQRLKLLPRKESGGSWYNPADYRFMGLLHGKKHYVDRVASYKLDPFGVPVKGADKKPIIDTSKPIYNVVMYRDLGDKRLPSFKVFIASLILMLVSVRSLHKRDKVVMAALKNPRGAVTA
jgi:hypothetical protein